MKSRVEVQTVLRWNRCSCRQSGPKTFWPAVAWLRGTTNPELLYVETKWASLIPLAEVADLLKEVLPAEAKHETIRRHVLETAEAMEEELERNVGATCRR